MWKMMFVVGVSLRLLCCIRVTFNVVIDVLVVGGCGFASGANENSDDVVDVVDYDAASSHARLTVMDYSFALDQFWVP